MRNERKYGTPNSVGVEGVSDPPQQIAKYHYLPLFVTSAYESTLFNCVLSLNGLSPQCNSTKLCSFSAFTLDLIVFFFSLES